MKQYQSFSEQDFVNDPDFQDWVFHPNGEKNQFWNNLIKVHPQIAAKVNEAKNLLLSISFVENFPDAVRVEYVLSKVLSRINEPANETKIVRMQPFLKRLLVAASILIFISTSLYFLLQNKPGKKQELVENIITKDVTAPTVSKASIILSDGTVVLIDSIANGIFAMQGNVRVQKNAEGEIVYNGASNEIQYNTLSNPRGSKIVSLTLNDGTKVWLNSESSLRYPVAFTGKSRNVEITGEVYFEVAKDALKNFTVTSNGVTTEVLGTHFNVNAYDDENDIKVTLLEGSVKVAKGSSANILIPGQQAQVAATIKIIDGIDSQEVMAWKDGKFQFGEKADIPSIMRQIARWYNVDIEYKGTVNGHIGGSMSRNVNVSQVLKMLEKTGVVKFSIEGKKLIVMP